MRIAICDDNEAVVNSVKNALLLCKDLYPKIKLYEFFSGVSLLESYKQGNSYDLIFLDIQMDELDGINTALRIKIIHKDVMLIFLTGHNIYVKEAFSVQAFQYLTKPVKQDEIIKEFKRAFEQYKLSRTKYKIEDKQSTIFVEIKNIIYMEVRNHMITIHTDKDEYVVKGKLKDEEDKLKKYDFIRSHQGYLINMDWIQAINDDNILLKNGCRVPMSRRMRKTVINIFSTYIVGKCI